jgi:hypothetical protein
MKIQSHWGQNLWKFSLRRHGVCMLQIWWNTYLSLTFTDVGTFVLRFFLKTLLCLVSLTEYHETSSLRDASAAALLIGHLRFLLEILLSLKMLISSYFEMLLSWDTSSLRLIRRCFYLEMLLARFYSRRFCLEDTSIWDFMETLLSSFHLRCFYHETLMSWISWRHFYLEDASIMICFWLDSFIWRCFYLNFM